jgi:hypothetical protein
MTLGRAVLSGRLAASRRVTHRTNSCDEKLKNEQSVKAHNLSFLLAQNSFARSPTTSLERETVSVPFCARRRVIRSRENVARSSARATRRDATRSKRRAREFRSSHASPTVADSRASSHDRRVRGRVRAVADDRAASLAPRWQRSGALKGRDLVVSRRRSTRAIARPPRGANGAGIARRPTSARRTRRRARRGAIRPRARREADARARVTSPVVAFEEAD